MLTNKLIETAEKRLQAKFAQLEQIALFNQKKVLEAFKLNRVSGNHFSGTTGYGYGDIGRETLAKVFASAFMCEDAIVSPHITCGTHAIVVSLFGLLKADDLMLSISGKPYDTLNSVINGRGDGDGSFADYKIKYAEVSLKDGKLDEQNILAQIKSLKPRVVFLQRSRGYSLRDAITISEMKDIFEKIKNISPASIIVVDNCYGEFCEISEPTQAGADIIIGSLIKNPGGGMAQTGGYMAGKTEFIDRIAQRLNTSNLKREVGSYEMGYRNFFQGFFVAPHVVLQAMKSACLISEVMQSLGYNTLPKHNSALSDIVCSIEFGDEKKLIKFCQTIQANSPVDSFVNLEPWAMPGYDSNVIMAAGSFVSGSSIEFSGDSPVKPPFVAYCQGALTYEHVKIALTNYLDVVEKK